MSETNPKSRGTIAIIVQLLAVMYIVQIINVVTAGSLRGYGILPRDPGSLWFVFTAPFIHGGWLHLINNSFGFVVFSALILRRGAPFYAKTSLFIIIVGGCLVWGLGRSAIHIGASGWIFGLWSLIIAMAWFERSLMNIAISLGVIIFYGGMIFGVLPTNSRISFESHLFGAIAGIAAAALFSYKKKGS